MGATYLTEMANWLREAGLDVVEYDGWKTRSRSSGGYDPGRPVVVMWHHTASSTSPENDAYYMCYTSSDRPICNVMMDRTGKAWVLAAGCTNTNGKGGPVTIPPSNTVPKDSMNTYAVGMEICNNGVGESYPQVQIDAAFKVSLTLCSRLGLVPDAVETHQHYAPDRKIDPATAAAVQGPWKPNSVTSSGTWSVDALRAECRRRSQTVPPIPPAGGLPPLPSYPDPDEENVDMPKQLVRSGRDDDSAWNAFVCWGGGKFWLSTEGSLAQAQKDFGYFPIKVDAAWMEATGPVDGPNPTDNAYGVWSETGSLSAAVAEPAEFTASGAEEDQSRQEEPADA